MADEATLNSAEFTALSAQITALRSQVQQMITEFENLNITVSGKTDAVTWSKFNLYSEQRFQAIENTLSDATRFGSNAYFLDRANHTGAEIVRANCSFGSNMNSKLGFYGSAGAVQQTVPNVSIGTAGLTYGATEQAMLQDVRDKVSTLITALKTLNLFI